MGSCDVDGGDLGAEGRGKRELELELCKTRRGQFCNSSSNSGSESFFLSGTADAFKGRRPLAVIGWRVLDTIVH